MPIGTYPRTKKYLKKLKKQGFQKGNKPWNSGKTQFDNETLKKIANSKRGKHHSLETEFEKGHKPYKIFGEKHGSWKGGISSYSYKLRRSIKWKQWRKEVFERDNYTCQQCSYSPKYDKEIIELHPHHIFPVRKLVKTIFEKHIFNLDNGITLCEECHKQLNKIRD